MFLDGNIVALSLLLLVIDITLNKKTHSQDGRHICQVND